MEPSHPGALHLSGLIASRSGLIELAIEQIIKSIRIKPTADRHFNLGVVFYNQGSAEAAAAQFEQALVLNPDFFEAQFKLGAAQRDMGELKSALTCFQRAIKLKDDADSHHMIGEVLMLQGELAASVKSFQLAITKLLSNLPPQKPVQKPFAVGSARQTLFIIRKHFGAAKIPFFLSNGTLLGIYRQGDLLSHDKDLDLGIPWDIDRSRILSILTKQGEFIYRDAQIKTDEDRQWMIGLVHKESGVFVDLFFFKPDGDYYLCGFNQRPHPLLCRPHRFDLDSFNWQGVDWMVPSDCELYLTDIYGPNWRVPDANFDTVVANHCQTRESKPIRRCFGYTRLYHRLKNRHLSRAAGYCEQLLRLQHEQFLVDLSVWIEQEISSD